jgi:transketolase
MKNSSSYYIEIAKAIRKDILYMHSKSSTSHIGSSLSCIEILVSLYWDILKISPRDPYNENRDRFILSKGHACSSMYATLAKRRFFHEKILDTYCVNGGKLFGHVTRGIIPGIESSAGSLGHGLSIGIGMAVAGRYDRKNFRVFVLMSDGECNEGSVWEGALFAAHHKLDNLISIIDYNKLQAFGRTDEVISLEPFVEKWKSFGWAVKETDGHNFGQLIKILGSVPFEKNKPSIIIAHTVKGKGISFMENKLEWHYKSPNQEILKIALEELNSS